MKKWYVKILIILLGIVISFFTLLLAVDVNFLWLFGNSPSVDEIGHGILPEASVIYSADNKVIGKFFTENRSEVKFNELPEDLINTLVSTEDERFYSHYGIDFQGLVSALKDIVFNSKKRGASTITQQLVKNLYKTRTSKYSHGLLGKIPGIKTLVAKLKEWLVAFKIEMRFSKQEILVMYFNTVDFGSNAYGIKTAAKTYFNKLPENLKIEEDAVLIGLLKATTTYNPKLNPKNSLKRRNTVLQNMVKNGFLTQNQCDSLTRIPIKLNFSVEDNYDGIALHFRDQLAQYLKEWLKETNRNLYNDGLKIYVTIDSAMQKYAEEAAREHLKNLQDSFNLHWKGRNPWCNMYHQEIPNFIENIAYKLPIFKSFINRGYDTLKALQALNKPHKLSVFDYNGGQKDTILSTMDSIRYMVKFLHCALVAIEPKSRHIKAWVGDLDFKFWKYDKVTALRQPGSTFKLFDYTEAMNQGFSPCDERKDQYVVWPVWDNGKRKQWVPHNADWICTDTVYSLRAAFARSINTVAVQVSKEVGIENICKTAHAMGITTPLNDTMPSTCLGGNDVTLLDLTNSYCTIMADGEYQAPILVTKILDKNGEVIYTAPEHTIQALDYEPAFLMQTMLKGAMTEHHCTSGYLWRYVREWYNDCGFGGKTGTSNNHSDGWFIGVTPGLVSGVWVGGEFRSIHFRSGEIAGGNFTALPVCGKFLQKVLSDTTFNRYHQKFPLPKTTISRNYNCNAYNYDVDTLSAEN
ncbi:MAG: transglycosylase domain-containing protein [Bacteroidales bacterium]|nr:transglycosylase domain-containing protein [Bacteroidales bacterium]